MFDNYQLHLHIKSFLLGVAVCIAVLSTFQHLFVTDDSAIDYLHRRASQSNGAADEWKSASTSSKDKTMPLHHHRDVQPGVEKMLRPSLHFINGKYGGRTFTPPDTVGVTSFNIERNHKVFTERLPSFKPSMASQTSRSLNFVVGGFAKTGTTFLTEWLNNDSIHTIKGEQCQFAAGSGYSLGPEIPDAKPITLVDTLIHGRLRYRGKILGFKCPNLVEDDIVDDLFSTYYPDTDFIIGLRHPVKWFQSFYNFRLKKILNPAPLVNELIGSKCDYGLGWKLCTDRAKFALPLAKLGKTELSLEEVKMLAKMVRDDDPHYKEKHDLVRRFFVHKEKPSIGRVFLYDLDQLADTDESRLETFAADLAKFLKLHDPLTVPSREEHQRLLKDKSMNGYLHYNGEFDQKRWGEFDRPKNEIKEVKRRHELLKIDICDPLYDEVRNALLEEGKQTSEWLLDYFLRSPDIHVSQRDRLEEIIAGYAIDPCA